MNQVLFGVSTSVFCQFQLCSGVHSVGAGYRRWAIQDINSEKELDF
jgi:hypothetical protein